MLASGIQPELHIDFSLAALG